MLGGGRSPVRTYRSVFPRVNVACGSAASVRERLDGLGPERCVVAEHPEHVGAALLLDVREDRVERGRVAVDVREGDEPQAVAHARPALWSCA